MKKAQFGNGYTVVVMTKRAEHSLDHDEWRVKNSFRDDKYGSMDAAYAAATSYASALENILAARVSRAFCLPGI